MLLLLSFNAIASEYQFDIGYSQVEHAWRGPNNVATFKPVMKSIGFTSIYDNGFAYRFGYGELNHVGTTGRYSHYTLEMDYIASLEIMYRYSVNNLTVFGGIGTYIIPASVRATNGYYDKDYDNDEGYFLGAEYSIYNKISLGYKFNMYSRIKNNPYDEWTKGHSIYLAYKF